jgi:hypothetical protein
MPAVAAEEKGCALPDAAAEALGPDEYGRLEAFLERRTIALVRDGQS